MCVLADFGTDGRLRQTCSGCGTCCHAVSARGSSGRHPLPAPGLDKLRIDQHPRGRLTYSGIRRASNRAEASPKAPGRYPLSISHLFCRSRRWRRASLWPRVWRRRDAARHSVRPEKDADKAGVGHSRWKKTQIEARAGSPTPSAILIQQLKISPAMLFLHRIPHPSGRKTGATAVFVVTLFSFVSPAVWQHL